MVMDGLSCDQYEPMPDGLRSPSAMCGLVGSSGMFPSDTCSSTEQCDDNNSVLVAADGKNTDIGIMTDVSSEDEYISGDLDIGYQREIIDGVTVYYGGDLDDSEDLEWEDLEDIARRAHVENYNFDLLQGMQPLVVVPSQKRSRADQCKSRGTYLSDEQDNRIVDDDSIVDQEIR